MIQLILSWVYIGVNFLIWGMGVKVAIRKLLKTDLKQLDLLMVLGGAMLTTYAQYFSLFYKVGLVANLVLIGIDAFIVWCAHKDIKELLGG